MKRGITAVACGLACSAMGVELPSSQPEAEGMSADRLDRVTAVARRYVQAGELPGAMTAVARNGTIVHAATVGSRGTDDNRPLSADAIYRLYSTTKVVTSVAVMQMYEQGRLQWSDPVAKFVPELANLVVLADGDETPARTPVTMRQLVTHTSGLSYGLEPDPPPSTGSTSTRCAVDDGGPRRVRREDRQAAATDAPPAPSGATRVGMDIAGLVVQRLSGQRFDRYLADNVFGPTRHARHLVLGTHGEARAPSAEPCPRRPRGWQHTAGRPRQPRCGHSAGRPLRARLRFRLRLRQRHVVLGRRRTRLHGPPTS